jgi:hypothetical protein
MQHAGILAPLFEARTLWSGNRRKDRRAERSSAGSRNFTNATDYGFGFRLRGFNSSDPEDKETVYRERKLIPSKPSIPRPKNIAPSKHGPLCDVQHSGVRATLQ